MARDRANGKTAAPDLPKTDIEAARRLSWELRHDSSGEMQRRRWVVGLSMLGVTLAQLMALQQTGIVRKLPDVPGPRVDPDEVNKHAYAYRRLALPNALLQVISFGATAALAAAGGSDRARRRPWLPLALLAKTGFDGWLAAREAQDALRHTRRVESYAALSGLTTLACIGLAAFDAWSASRAIADEGRARYPQVRDAARERGRRALEQGRDLLEQGRDRARDALEQGRGIGRGVVDQGRDLGRDLGRRGAGLVDRARSRMGELRPG
jgi:hypothetical protein